MAESLPPDQQKRMGSDIFKKPSEGVEVCVLPKRAGQALASPAPTERSSIGETRNGRDILLAAAEGVADAGAHIAAKSGVAESVLIALVEEIGGAGVELYAAGELVVGGEVEAGVAGIACEAEAEEVAIGADAGEVA